MRHLRLPVRLTRVGMAAENAVRCFWPVWTIGFLCLAPLMMGWQDILPLEVVGAFAGVGGVAFVAALVWGARRFHMPTTTEALARVDAAMPGRPIAAVADVQAIGASDPASVAVWQAHVARMAERTKSARAVEPDLRIADRDPYGLRFIAVLFFVTALLFGSFLRVASVGDIVTGPSAAMASGPIWEGWVEPPAYTGRPSLYLNDIPEGPLRVPEGSRVTLRVYGDNGRISLIEDVSGRGEEVTPLSDGQQQFDIVYSGTFALDGENGRRWTVTAVADEPPFVTLTDPITSDAMGEMSQPFRATDDYGIESGTATIALDLAAVERVHGLTTDPDPIAPLVLDLPMPFTGDRTEFDAFLVENLSEHPLANLPVTLQLSVTDAAGQTATTAPEPLILPGRRFFQPFARAVIEQRRDLMWSRDNARRVGQILRAVSHRPEDIFTSETMYLRLRTIIRRIDNTMLVGMDDEAQAEIVTALWDLAIQLEDGRLADARERLRRAQERLAEAMRNGASDAEIAELMQELREATNDYMRMLAEQAEPGDGTDQADNSENSMEMSMSDLQAMMDRIEELMQEGRMEEAQALMEELNRLMENMRVTQGEGGDGPPMPGQQSMQDLAETLRDQQDLSDDAFRELQEGFNQGQQGQQPGQQGQDGQQDGQQGQDGDQPGQQGQNGQQQGQGQGGQQGEDGQGSGSDPRSLSDRQQALRQELQRQRDGLPNLPGDAGEAARNSLDRAEGAMEGAEEALRGGDLAEAIDRQAEALDALRNGMRELGQALAEGQTGEPGQQGEQGEAAGRAVPGQRDPLGRETGNTGQMGTDQNLLGGLDINRRAAELLDEIRRRSAEQDRPEVERDYLRRLLGQF
ncbi:MULTISPECIES: TIGR02302 family protein [unclassified Yoonia]|uniref:TIGR02302 family protein n=1 Tax=unclassified Yoonia TaxID=2629118 RepID=UPI002AFFE2D2|nr:MULTISPECIES: TIGR02302 family protein [unclassified Yoonia]